ncbi:hypothetical protein PROFUN_01121 [Planoprotostelium fungivorum]|uniref:Uncharacterized protein n=1 Tax=Planoprotostelium fungivorum TaxID=1890364 RepID=A0A2P6NCC0_9EUKA|nr:hypothetical protein PROFUN_01121 [Planoprotostelium fungivorum]
MMTQEKNAKLTQFQTSVIDRYKKCILTGSYLVSNGLLLRLDLVSLFDQHLIRFKPLPNSDKVETEIDHKLRGTEYSKFEGKLITLTDPVTRELLSLKRRGPHIWLKIEQLK